MGEQPLPVLSVATSPSRLGGHRAGDHLHELCVGEVGRAGGNPQTLERGAGEQPQSLCCRPQGSNCIAKCGIIHHHVET